MSTIITKNDIERGSIFIESMEDQFDYIDKYMSIPIDVELQHAMDYANKYMYKHKRILVGSTAHKMVIEHISNNKDTIDAAIDYDYYSTDPIKDSIEIADILYKTNHDYIQATSAVHRDTFTVSYKGKRIIDITYIPKNIYKKMPYIKINNFYCIHPFIALIDLFRMSANAFANFRWKKALKRMHLLLKYFPITNKVNVNLSNSIFYESQDNINTVLEFIKEASKHDIILIGDYIFSLYLNKNIIRTIDFYCIDYMHTTKILINKFRHLYKNKFKYKQFYAFYEFLPKHTILYVDNEPVVKIYDRNNICYTNIIHNNMRICTFFNNVAYLMSIIFYNKVFNKPYKYEQTLLNNIVKSRHNYLQHNKVTIFDKGHLYTEYSIDCIFPVISPKLEMLLYNIPFKYMPENKLQKIEYEYYNNSGEEIKIEN